jgi:PAS domain S-box-containing protein
MIPCRLLVVAPDASCAATLAAAVPPDTIEAIWHSADDGGIFVAVLHDGLWDAVVFWGDPKAFAGGRSLELVRASLPDLPIVLVSGDNASETAARALQLGARAWLPVDDLGSLAGFVSDLQASRQQDRRLGEIAAVAGQHSERYRGLIELSPDPLLVHRRGVFIYANAAIARLMGASSPEALEGRTLFEFLHPDDRTEAVQRAQRVWSEAQLPPAEWRVYRLDGSLRHVETSAWPIIYEDEPANLLVCRDITDRKLAEETRQRLLIQEQEARAAADAARERLRFLADAASVVNAQLDRQATLENVARVLVPRLADWCIIDEVLPGDGMELATVIHAAPEVAARIRATRARYPIDFDSDELVARIFRSGKSELIADLQSLDLTQLPDGSKFQKPKEAGVRSLLCVPLVARERVLGVLTLVASKDRRPYTDDDVPLVEEVAAKAALALDNARLYGALQEADHRKEEFLGLLGHELRNPLAGIRNAVHLLQRRPDQPDQVERWTGVIDRQQRLLSRLVEDLLDISRINSGKIALNRQAVDLAQIVGDGAEAAMHAHGLAAEQMRITLPAGPLLVSGDAIRLAQIVSNLLDNAWKYNVPGGHVLVDLTAKEGVASLTVTDTGLGIAAHAMATIFDPFVQLNVGDRAKAGLGLGLTLVKRLTEMHGGTISVSSPGEGQGSTFCLQMPLLDGPDGATGEG